MRHLLFIGAASILAAACSNETSSANPARLWLAPDGSEVQVKLVNAEPPHY